MLAPHREEVQLISQQIVKSGSGTGDHHEFKKIVKAIDR